jgi:tRNA(fMet)-specific endonuclease VapC
MAPRSEGGPENSETSNRQMAIILDTDVLVQGERGTFELEEWLASRPNDEFEVAAITVAELWHGVERATGVHRASRELYVRAILETFPIIPYTEQTAYVHARIWAELEAAGKMVGYYDLIVGATALERGGQVATFNKRHFAEIKDLGIIEPK